MPYKKTYRKKKYNNKRKTFKRKGKRMGMKPSHVRIRGPSAVPDYVDVKLKYVEVGTKTATVVYNQAQYSGNSVFNPQNTGGYGSSHQPMGFDQWATLYGSYMVKASSIEVDFVPSGVAQSLLYPVVASGTAPSTLAAALEYPRVKTTMSSIASGRTRLKHYMTTAGVYGLKSLNNDDQPYCALVGANPALQWFWIFGFQDPDVTTSTIQSAKITITYYVRFFGRINLSQS